jgi:hypothetical protein
VAWDLSIPSLSHLEIRFQSSAPKFPAAPNTPEDSQKESVALPASRRRRC